MRTSLTDPHGAHPFSDALAVLGDLIGFPTVTADSNLDLIEHAESLLTDAGARVTRTYDEHHTKANLFATIGPDVDGGVVLSGHTDVVPAEAADWTGAPFIAARREGRIYGRGAADMKGFIACVLACAPTFASTDLRRPVHVALTFDEEVGFLGAPLLLEELARSGRHPAAAIVGEPTSMRVVAAHKGCHEFTTTIEGVEGHGSAPANAASAVEAAARYVAALVGLRGELARRAPADSLFDPPGSTISVGTINGGTARNIVAGECTFEWEFRPVNAADVELVTRAVADLERDLTAYSDDGSPPVRISTTSVAAVDGLEPAGDSPAVELVSKLVDADSTDAVSFGTEAGLYQRAGIPAVVCGPGSIDAAHQPDEYIEETQLERCLVMLERLRRELSA